MKVYFICRPTPVIAEYSSYHHQTIAIAEGLRILGIEFYGNINYWKETADSDTFLIKKSPLPIEEFDVVVMETPLSNFDGIRIHSPDFFTKKRNYKLIYIDSWDGLITPGFEERYRNVDFVLKSHFNAKYRYPENFHPWQFGLTNRIIKAVQPIDFAKRNKEILVNFRPRHQLRSMAQKKVMPYIENHYSANTEVDAFDAFEQFNSYDFLHWRQTGRRHYPTYYKRLGNAQLCSTFGGILQKSVSNCEMSEYGKRVLRKIDNKLNILPYDRVYQFDSWRFWESLVSGCCTLHLDFEKYGMILPVMPKNGRDYIGVDFKNLTRLSAILGDSHEVQAIGKQGREWVLEHYSPKVVANRFLELIG